MDFRYYWHYCVAFDVCIKIKHGLDKEHHKSHGILGTGSLCTGQEWFEDIKAAILSQCKGSIPGTLVIESLTLVSDLVATNKG